MITTQSDYVTVKEVKELIASKNLANDAKVIFRVRDPEMAKFTDAVNQLPTDEEQDILDAAHAEAYKKVMSQQEN